MPTGRTYLQAWLNGVPLTRILSASCTYGWKLGVPTATVYVPMNPVPGTPLYNQSLDLRMGAGSNNIQRFVGLFRGYSYAMWPRALGLRFKGLLTLAAEYQNHSDSSPNVGGLTLLQLMGSPTATDAAVVQAVLSAAGVSYTAANIKGTGLTWGTKNWPTNYLWRAGTSTDPKIMLYGAGQSALDYIQQWDAVSAVYTSNTAPVGFYRTYETVHGVYRALIGGRPRTGIDLTFTEGIDIEQTAQSARDYPIANSAFVTGYDPGTGTGPIKNVDGSGNFLGAGSNAYQTKPITQNFNSPFIEFNDVAAGGVGMDCQTVGNALLADLNRETVTVRFRTPRDDFAAPGMTMLVQGPGGQGDGGLQSLLGIGENLWIDQVTSGVDLTGFFYQDIQGTGGGSQGHAYDAYTPAPPY